MEEGKQNLHLVVFFAIIINLIVNVGNFEIQPWDEGLYAWRAYSIFESGNYFDQTNEALGGLYSSSPPPLTIWATYFFMKIFGVNEFAIRFFSVLCSIISAILIYNISILFLPRKWAILSPLLLSATLVWNNFSRQAMTEIPLNMFIIACFYLICKIYFENDKKKNLIYSILYSVTFAFAILTKNTISLFPILFVLIFLLSNELKEKKYALIFASLIGIILASPWYIYMINTYGHAFTSALFPTHINSVVEGNTRDSGVFYYLNTLIIFLPIIFYLIFSPKAIKNNYNSIKRNYQNNYFLINIILWFLAIFFTFSFSQTKNPHYSTYIIPPLILILVYTFSEISKNNLSKLSLISLIYFGIACFLWSSFSTLRISIKSNNLNLLSTSYIITLSVIAVLPLIILLLNKKQTQLISKFITSYSFIAILSILLFSKTIYNNVFIDPKINFTAKNSISYLKSMGAKSFIYLYHKQNDGDSLYPQLKWYLKQENFKPIVSLIEISNNKIDFDKLNKIQDLNDKYIVYYASKGLPYIEPTILELLSTRLLISFNGNYLIFSKSVRPIKNKTTI